MRSSPTMQRAAVRLTDRPMDTPRPRLTPATGRAVLCRAGFEKEAAGEMSALAGEARCGGYARAVADTGVAAFELYAAEDLGALQAACAWSRLVFARTAWDLHARIDGLPSRDRVGALREAFQSLRIQGSGLRVEHADSADARALSPLARALSLPLQRSFHEAGILRASEARTLHVLLMPDAAALLCSAMPGSASAWPGGIPRLRFPASAPSRSTLKLEEAFLVLLDESERHRWLAPGQRAVDLGAAPGGWTWQFVRRSIRVTAVDNGPMQAALLDSGLVEHRRDDGFRYLPPKPVDWLVCDMVEQPRRIAQLMARWLVGGHCARALFNLKLPMKKRREEVELCLGVLRTAVPGVRLRARQLYHDREEVTVLALPTPR